MINRIKNVVWKRILVHHNGFVRRAIAIVLIVAMVLSFVGCTPESGKKDNKPTSAEAIVDISVSDLVNDSFYTLDITEITGEAVTVVGISADEILVNCIEVNSIENIDIETTSINDEFVYLAYKNFVSVYGDDFDFTEFLKDVGIGAGCILVYVTLSTAGGPVGTFFGAIITSQFTTSAVVIGTAIDASVSAYKAYQEGGDLSYIVGHMLNGVADGFKWSAILAPATGALDGIKALKSVSKLRKIKGLENITDKEARKLFEALPDLIRSTERTAASLSDDAISKAYKALPDSIKKEISEEIFSAFLRNSGSIQAIVKEFNPFNVSKKVAAATRDRFLKNAGFDSEGAIQFVKKLKKGEIKELSEIGNASIKEYIEKNMYEFVECFGDSLSKDFVENTLKANLGNEAFESIKKAISSTEAYSDLIKNIGKEKLDVILTDANSLMLLQVRFGSKSIAKLSTANALYTVLVRDSSVAEKNIMEVLEGILDGRLKSLDDIAKINGQIAKNMVYSRELTAQLIRSTGKEKALAGLLDDLAQEGLVGLGISKECAKDIVSHSMTKADIISKYGAGVYEQLLSSEKVDLLIGCFSFQSKSNTVLIREMTTDVLKKQKLTDEAISAILCGKRITEWGISDEAFSQIGNVVADYYRACDLNMYSNYIAEMAEKRGESIKAFLEQFTKENTIKNVGYAGSIMEPHINSNVAYIKAKYGDIYMSKSGFAIFDRHAIARVELPNLTGDDAADIALANLLHHGTTTSIPGYTWHHLEDGKTLILIPTELHDAYRHTGGAALIREGLKG